MNDPIEDAIGPEVVAGGIRYLPIPAFRRMIVGLSDIPRFRQIHTPLLANSLITLTGSPEWTMRTEHRSQTYTDPNYPLGQRTALGLVDSLS